MSSQQNLQQASYSIGVVSRLTGISAHCLRMWERRHGLGPSSRTAGGQREYSKVDLDHLSLIKQLLDQGMRIKDIAALPQKTLSLMATQSANEDTELNQPFDTVVIGRAFSALFKKHRNRYPRLSIEFPSVSAEQWINTFTEPFAAKIVILQADTVNQQTLVKLKHYKQQGCSIFLHHPALSDAIKEQLGREGIACIDSPINLELIDRLTARAQKEQTYISGLFDSSREFNLPLPASIPHYFSDQALTEAAGINSAITCQCPSHLSELIRSLNAFEQYSQQCGAENWKQASVHACIYAYTAQARGLLEQALLAAIDEH
ncbi:MerR family transcriptional regulator [Oceanicoccus sagamiensis]|uniref:HTH merR-type domain-containing protein n=1 Tax=Oceanicoccus sagamiensis TaxID=716816 RepID=A0A1X9NDB6_9GAMM|nr:MerR family transcriptional regulator [Oceanicoccus sagamiensis]ARN75151.1 hypothetical protein BST96_14120 [Oceanicoccus sagamiensis]